MTDSPSKDQRCEYCDEGRERDKDGWHTSKYVAHGWVRCKLWTPPGAYRDATGELVLPAPISSNPLFSPTKAAREWAHRRGRADDAMLIEAWTTGWNARCIPEEPGALADHLRSMLLDGTVQCPLCGRTGPHPHSPEEIVIYRNGVKYGRSLKVTPDETQPAASNRRAYWADIISRGQSGTFLTSAQCQEVASLLAEDTPPTCSKEHLRWRKAFDAHPNPWVLEVVRDDGEIAWTLMCAERPLGVIGADETSEPPEPTTDMIKQGIWAWERTGSRSVADDVRAIYVAMRRMEMRAVEPTPCPECVAVRKLGLLACQKHLPEKASCRHVFDFVPFKGVVCTRCGVAATTETIPPNHSAHHWIKQGAGAICDGCGLIGGDPSSSSEKASAFKCVCGELHTLGDGHVCKSQKASDDLNCLICGKLWRSQHTDQERADCSAAL